MDNVGSDVLLHYGIWMDMHFYAQLVTVARLLEQVKDNMILDKMNHLSTHYHYHYRSHFLHHKSNYNRNNHHQNQNHFQHQSHYQYLGKREKSRIEVSC